MFLLTIFSILIVLIQFSIQHNPQSQYSFGYSVHDSQTGDIKSRHEVRNGDNVEGHYSLIEPDGSKRIVEYHADSLNGFNAVVHREGLNHHPPASQHLIPRPPLLKLHHSPDGISYRYGISLPSYFHHH